MTKTINHQLDTLKLSMGRTSQFPKLSGYTLKQPNDCISCTKAINGIPKDSKCKSICGTAKRLHKRKPDIRVYLKQRSIVITRIGKLSISLSEAKSILRMTDLLQ